MNAPLPRILAILLGGVLINVAVALGCALWSSAPPERSAAPMRRGQWPREVSTRWPQEDILIDSERALGLTVIKSRALVQRTKEPANALAAYMDLIRALPQDDSSRQVQIIEDATALMRTIQADDPETLERRAAAVLEFVRENSTGFDEATRSRINLLLIPLTDLFMPYSLHVVEAGWPMRSLQAEARSEASLEPRGRYAMRLGFGRAGFHSPSGRWLPVWPTWPGFAVNSLLYALLLAPIVAAPRFVLRLLRRNAGQCPECGAPIGVDSCCEHCGGDLSGFWRG